MASSTCLPRTGLYVGEVVLPGQASSVDRPLAPSYSMRGEDPAWPHQCEPCPPMLGFATAGFAGICCMASRGMPLPGRQRLLAAQQINAMEAGRLWPPGGPFGVMKQRAVLACALRAAGMASCRARPTTAAVAVFRRPREPRVGMQEHRL